MPSPKPKPTNLKLLHGNPGKRALPVNEPQPELVTVDCPAPHRLTPRAAIHWAETLPILVGMRVLSVADLAALEIYCEARSDEDHANEMIAEHGLVTIAQSGYTQVSAWYSIRKQARADRLKIAGLFGMTPSDRTKVATVAAPEPSNPFL